MLRIQRCTFHFRLLMNSRKSHTRPYSLAFYHHFSLQHPLRHSSGCLVCFAPSAITFGRSFHQSTHHLNLKRSVLELVQLSRFTQSEYQFPHSVMVKRTRLGHGSTPDSLRLGGQAANDCLRMLIGWRSWYLGCELMLYYPASTYSTCPLLSASG